MSNPSILTINIGTGPPKEGDWSFTVEFPQGWSNEQKTSLIEFRYLTASTVENQELYLCVSGEHIVEDDIVTLRATKWYAYHSIDPFVASLNTMNYLAGEYEEYDSKQEAQEECVRFYTNYHANSRSLEVATNLQKIPR